jgi:hypothetical protein
MFTGSSAGRFGAEIADWLQKKYGKRKAHLISGVVFALFGLTMLGGLLYELPHPITEADFEIIQVAPREAYYYRPLANSRPGRIILVDTSSEEYSIHWWYRYSRDDIVNALNREKTVTLWVLPRSVLPVNQSVYGLRAGNIFQDPWVGANRVNRNRKEGIVFCSVWSIIGVVYCVCTMLLVSPQASTKKTPAGWREPRSNPSIK